jgi:hypothetical protein
VAVLIFNLVGDGLRDLLDRGSRPMKQLLEVENLVVHFDTDRGLGEAAGSSYVARYCLRDYAPR